MAHPWRSLVTSIVLSAALLSTPAVPEAAASAVGCTAGGIDQSVCQTADARVFDHHHLGPR
jgi:hypothetical protein